MPPIKKIVTWILVVFVLYAILAEPSTAADIFQSVWENVWGSVQNIFVFFDNIMRG